MGLNIFLSGGRSEGYEPQPGNPNPSKFEIVKVEEICGNLVVKIHYPDSHNYEGNKIILYLNTTEKQLREKKELDPHFVEKGFSPFARFEPSAYGWKVAMHVARNFPSTIETLVKSGDSKPVPPVEQWRLQRWHYELLHSDTKKGFKQHMDVGEALTANQVAEEITRKHGQWGWDRKSLRKGKKVK